MEKWSLAGGTWKLDYTLQAGLGIGGSPYDVAGYGDVYTESLRDITGKVNGNGTVTIYGVTSTYSNIGDGMGNTIDSGADPNELVSITDTLAATTLPGSEMFNVLAGPVYGTVYRGVAFAPSVPEPASVLLLACGLAGLCVVHRRCPTG